MSNRRVRLLGVVAAAVATTMTLLSAGLGAQRPNAIFMGTTAYAATVHSPNHCDEGWSGTENKEGYAATAVSGFRFRTDIYACFDTSYDSSLGTGEIATMRYVATVWPKVTGVMPSVTMRFWVCGKPGGDFHATGYAVSSARINGYTGGQIGYCGPQVVSTVVVAERTLKVNL